MSNHHTARPGEWADQENWACHDADSSCILELRARIEALEAAQQPPQDKLDRLIALDRDAPAGSLVERIATDADLCKVYNEKTTLRAVYDLGRQHGAAPIRSAPESPLVERVADALYDVPLDSKVEARAAILEVAAALIDRWDSEGGSAWEAAKWLEQEANR